MKLIAVTITTIVGFICFAFINPQFGFNFMFLRLWQFSAGFIAMYWTKVSFYEYSEKLKPAKMEMALLLNKEDLVSAAIAILSLCLLPSKIEVLILRPLVTLATAFIIASQSQESQVSSIKSNHQNSFQLLKWTHLAYLGDISYVVYLVHWPIIALFIGANVKCYMFCVGRFTIVSSVTIHFSVITFVSAMLLHHLFEKQYLKSDMKTIIPLVCVLLLANAYLQNSVREHDFWNHTFPADLQLIVDKNKMFLPSLWENEPQKDECIESSLEDPIDKYRVFSYCRYPVRKRQCAERNLMFREAKETFRWWWSATAMLWISESTSELISTTTTQITDMSLLEVVQLCVSFDFLIFPESYGMYADTYGSQQALEVSRRQVERYKPDVLFISSRWYFRFQVVSDRIRSDIRHQSEFEFWRMTNICDRWMKT